MVRIITVIAFIVMSLPRQLFIGVGLLLGKLFWTILPKYRKKMAVKNIMDALALNEKEALQIAYLSTKRFGKMFMEMLLIPKLNKENITSYVTICGKENLIEALSHERGVILATAHFGNWEIAGAALAISGIPLVAVVQKQTNSFGDQILNKYRTCPGIDVTYKTNVRKVLRLLKQGKAVSIFMDQDAHRDGIFVDFLGRPSSTAKGAAVLSRMNNAPIVPIMISETEAEIPIISLYKPISPLKTADREKDIIQITQQLTSIIEQQIRKCPSEWFWLHNRWKTQPINKIDFASEVATSPENFRCN